MTSSEVELCGRRLTLTSLDRVLWPATGTTKRGLLDYYRAVAPAIVPHLAGRPLTLGRFPAGVEERGFAQNECRGAPEWLRTAELRLRTGETRRYCVVDDEPSLLWVVNLSAIELHPFLARVEEPEVPTAVVFDLDPEPPAGLADACRVALALRVRLAQRDLTAFPKVSGSVGVHVFVPLNTTVSFEQTKAFARELAQELEAELPHVTARMTRKASRTGKVLVDWLQNDPSRSTVAPYSLRATRLPRVSAPVDWEELARPERLAFDPHDVLDRLERHGDLFAPVLELRQRV